MLFRSAQDLPRANALEEAAVRALVGQKSIITGKVTDAFESPKGMTFLNLEGGKFTLVTWKDTYDKFEGGSPAKLYKGKTVEVTGEVFVFHAKGQSKEDPGKLEIKLASPDQIIILPTADPTPPTDPASDDKKAPKKEAKKDPKSKPETKPETPAADPKKTETPEKVDPKKYFK